MKFIYFTQPDLSSPPSPHSPHNFSLFDMETHLVEADEDTLPLVVGDWINCGKMYPVIVPPALSMHCDRLKHIPDAARLFLFPNEMSVKTGTFRAIAHGTSSLHVPRFALLASTIFLRTLSHAPTPRGDNLTLAPVDQVIFTTLGKYAQGIALAVKEMNTRTRKGAEVDEPGVYGCDLLFSSLRDAPSTYNMNSRVWAIFTYFTCLMRNPGAKLGLR